MTTASERETTSREPLTDTAGMAELLGTSVRYVQDECAAGRFPYRPIGRKYGFTAEMVTFILNLGAHWPDPEAAQPETSAAQAAPRPRRTRVRAADRVAAASTVTPLVARPLRSKGRRSA